MVKKLDKITIQDIRDVYAIHERTRKEFCHSDSDEKYEFNITMYLEGATYDHWIDVYYLDYQSVVNLEKELNSFKKLKKAIEENKTDLNSEPSQEIKSAEVLSTFNEYVNQKLFTTKNPKEILADAQEYSIWFKPDDNPCYLDHLIWNFCKTQDSHSFEPHVTLLGGIKGLESVIICKTQILSKIIPSFNIRLTRFKYSPAYFKRVFIEAELSETLESAYNRASHLFSHQKKPFEPHLSLIYGHLPGLYDEDIARNQLGGEFNLEMKADKLYLYDTSRSPEEWKKVAEFPLTKFWRKN